MIDVEKRIDYWRRGSAEDWEVAVKLVKDGKDPHGLSFAHLALERRLKAIICRRTHSVPPRIHHLTRLSEVARREGVRVVSDPDRQNEAI